jgi:hypothetical protein
MQNLLCQGKSMTGLRIVLTCNDFPVSPFVFKAQQIVDTCIRTDTRAGQPWYQRLGCLRASAP